MNIRELQKTVHAINVEKGWHRAPLREKSPPDFGAWHVYTDRVLAKLALVHSELTEAEVESANDRFDVYYSYYIYGDGKPKKPEGWIVEIADVLIRVLDTCEALGLDLQAAFERTRLLDSDYRLHGHVSLAVEAARVGDYDGAFLNALASLWQLCEEEATTMRLDLAAAIELKIAYNRTRPHMHGGKLA